MTSVQLQFGSRLRRERESRGVSLDAIAESTKISKALFVGLERGDLSRWPTGVYCRAHVCGYASAVGLSPSEVLAEFNQVFPDRCGDADLPPPLPRPAEAQPRLRLTFATAAQPTGETRMKRAAIAAVEALVLLTLGSLIALATGIGLWTVWAAAAFAYYPTTIASLGETAGFRLLPMGWAALQHWRARSSKGVEEDSAVAFGESPVQPVSEPGALRLEPADALSGAMVLNTKIAQDPGAAPEYLLH